jgi:NAD(P)H-hydrate epimerase
MATLLERLADLRAPIVAIDGPTGLDLATGVTYLPTRADLSVTFGALRRGHLLARDDVGGVVVADIGHPPPNPDWPVLVTDEDAVDAIPRLRARFHKGDRGRALVIGGHPGMSGAIRMAGRAAFGAGAGLVHAVAPSETVAVTEYVPAVVGVPEMKPVDEPTANPGGRPVAEYATGRPSGSDPTSCSESD